MKFAMKSFRFDVDNPVLKNFIDKQSNFSSAMKYLILHYCSTHPEVEDLSTKYKEIKTYAMMEQIRKLEGEEMPAPQAGAKPAEPAGDQEEAYTEEPAEETAALAPEPKEKAPNKTQSTRKTKKAPATKKVADAEADKDVRTISKDYSEYM